ncbi:MAG: hypothetical protein IJ671_00790 [Succinivibrio sp.]|jgi:hypothetical protein|nr:hypothetical protein [Succinivibrio sp.]
MRVCCEELHISYQKVRRLCRHYVRASKDPALAVRWCLGSEVLHSTEQKTWKYQQDLEKSYDRQEKLKDKMYQQFIDNF